MPPAKAKPKPRKTTKAPAKKPPAARKQPAPRKVPPRAPAPTGSTADWQVRYEPEHALSPDDTARVGFFAKVVAGPHKGRYGVVHAQTEDTMILRTRDAEDEMLHVQPHELRPDVAGKR